MVHLNLRTEAAILTATSSVDHFDAYTGGSGRTFAVRSTPPDASLQVAIEAGKSLTDSGSGVPIAQVTGPAGSVHVIDGSASLRYRIVHQDASLASTVEVWVDAPADTQGATGAAGINGVLAKTAVLTADPNPVLIDTVSFFDTSGGALDAHLPAISADNDGHELELVVVNTSANALTPVVAGSDTLGGGLTTVSGLYGKVRLKADNSPSPKVWRPI